jgi:hypothetical protein
LFVGGLMSYLRYVHFVFTSSCLWRALVLFTLHNVNKTRAVLQTNGDKDEVNIT